MFDAYMNGILLNTYKQNENKCTSTISNMFQLIRTFASTPKSTEKFI